MAKPRVCLSVVPISDLINLAKTVKTDPAFRYTVPITESLAAAFTANPYADPSDPALIVAFVDDVCVGYLGLLPTRLRNLSQPTKVFCRLSSFVESDFRPMGIAVLLIRKMLSLKLDLYGEDPCPLLERFGFIHEPASAGYAILQFEVLKIAEKALHRLQSFFDKSGFKRVARFVKWLKRIHDASVYPILKQITYLVLICHSSFGGRRFSFQQVDELSTAFEDYEPQHSKFGHDIKWLNWKLKNNWFVEGPNRSKLPPNYRFFDTRKIYKPIAVEITEPGESVAKGFFIAILSQIDDHWPLVLKVGEYRSATDDMSDVLRGILRLARAHGVDKIEFSSDLARSVADSHIWKPWLTHHNLAYAFFPGSTEGAIRLKESNPEFFDSHYGFM